MGQMHRSRDTEEHCGFDLRRLDTEECLHAVAVVLADIIERHAKMCLRQAGLVIHSADKELPVDLFFGRDVRQVQD